MSAILKRKYFLHTTRLYIVHWSRYFKQLVGRAKLRSFKMIVSSLEILLQFSILNIVSKV